MKNDYLDTNMGYSEILVTLENFGYDTKVKCSIPSLMPLLNKDKVIEDKTRPSHMNITNKNISMLGIGKCTSCNYIDIFISSKYDTSGKNVGTKGQKFVITFVGGDINRCNIIGRYEE